MKRSVGSNVVIGLFSPIPMAFWGLKSAHSMKIIFIEKENLTNIEAVGKWYILSLWL